MSNYSLVGLMVDQFERGYCLTKVAVTEDGLETMEGMICIHLINYRGD